MHLLILSTENQEAAAEKIAESIGIYGKIVCLDEAPSNSLVIDTCVNYN